MSSGRTKYLILFIGVIAVVSFAVLSTFWLPGNSPYVFPAAFTPALKTADSLVLIPTSTPIVTQTPEPPAPSSPLSTPSPTRTITTAPWLANTKTLMVFRTQSHWSDLAPAALVTPAPDASGELLFFELLKDDRAKLMEITIDADGNPSGEAAQIPFDNLSFQLVYGDVYPSPDGQKVLLNPLDAFGYKTLLDLQNGTNESFRSSEMAFFDWYPDSQWVLTGNDNSPSALVLRSVFNDQNVEVSMSNAGFFYDAAISPDGTKIVYSDVYSNSAPGGLWIIDLKNNEQYQISNLAGQASYLEWSPDGTKISYWLDGEIWVMDADGSQARSLGAYRLFSQPYFTDMTPRWSPDSRTLMVNYFTTRIGYTSSAYDGSNIDLIDVETGQRRTLLPNGSSGHLEPCWSPDGRQIAFLSIISGKPQVWIIGADGSALHQVTHSDNWLQSLFWRRP